MAQLNSRRMAARISSIIVILAILLSVILANVIGEQTSRRLDLTLAGQQHLSPRTQKLLDRLPQGFEIVLAADRASTDGNSFDAVVDVFRTMDQQSPSLGFRMIDVGAPAGRDQFLALIDHLKERDRPMIDAQKARLLAFADTLDAVQQDLAKSAKSAGALATATPSDRQDAQGIRQFFTQSSTLLTFSATQLQKLGDSVRSELSSDTQLADTATLRDRVVPELKSTNAQIATLVAQLARFGSTTTMPEAQRSQASTLAQSLGTLHDRLATESDALSRFQQPPVFRVSTALESGQACLVIGPRDVGLTAVDLDTLLPNTAGLGRAGVAAPPEIARRAEDLIGIALSSLLSPDRPILVMLHAEIEPFVMSTPTFEQFIDRNRLRGVDVVEWPIMTDDDPPAALEQLNPNRTRPVVYFVIAPNSAAAGKGGSEELAGARRATKLGTILQKLVADGASMLVNVNPSIFPTYGDDDPIADAVRPFGLVPRTGSPIVFEQLAQNGQHVTLTAVDAVGIEGEQPLSQAIAGLHARLLWPIAIDAEPVDGVKATPLLRVQGGAGRWMESQWIALWQAASSRGASAVTAQFDAARDARRDEYILARAAERTIEGRTQRIICVGSNSWALDSIAQTRTTVDGRLAPVSPGNLELIDASVFWLAGQDDMIARGVSTASTAMIRPIDPARRVQLEWAILAGLPLGVLVIGLGYRLVRG